MSLTLLVTLVSGLGAVTRYVLDRAVTARLAAAFPYGTLVVNLSGSFVLGLVIGLSLHHGLSSDAATVLGVGFAGGYTTLSTWAWETLALVGDGDRRGALANVVGSVGLGLLAAAAGLGLALI